MKVIDVMRSHENASVYKILEDDSDDPLNSIIEKTNFSLIPNDDISECSYLVKGIIIRNDKNNLYCFITISAPERIISDVIYCENYEIIVKSIYDFEEDDIIPAVASLCFGDYELYYSKIDPNIGIEVLKQGLKLSPNNSIIAEDLGYILRDENRYSESINSFIISANNSPSSEYVFWELHRLYKQISDDGKSGFYYDLFKKNGGIELNLKKKKWFEFWK